MTILLLGANDRACYSLAKAYSQEGYTITVLNDSSHPIRHSRFINFFIRIPYSFERETDNAIEAILNHLQKNKYKITIPVHDTTLSICFKINQQLLLLTSVMFINKPDAHVFCNDKATLLNRCKELNIPTPYSVMINKLKDLDNIQLVNFPCIARPISSKVYANGKIFSYTAKKINTREELIDFVREKIETVPIMVQEILSDGFGVGYNFLSKNGQVINAYAHERINEAWGGGQSTYRKTISPNQYNIEAYSRKLIQSIQWTGIAMIEYRIVNGTAYIMEINGRSWGSIQLGIFAGCNLPVDMTKALYNEEPIQPYIHTTDYYVRNLFNETIWAIQSKSLLVIVKWIYSLRKSFGKYQLIEDNIFIDPFFRCSYIMKTIIEQLNRMRNKIREKLLISFIKTINKQSLNKTFNIAFICKGNINRSAFAEYYIKENYPLYNVSSYGTVFEEQRLSPSFAVEAASHLGIDLEKHRSKYLTQQAIDKTDIFIIMDTKNFVDLKNLHVASEKIFLLKKEGVTDPYSKDLSFFKMVFNEIAESLDLIITEY